jgi:hypothetical protein
VNQPAHKTEGVYRTQTLRFYPFVFTGKEKDEETGYGYFGARYMDHVSSTIVTVACFLILLFPGENEGVKPQGLSAV